MSISNLKARKKARQLLMQAIYQQQINDMDWYSTQMQFHQMNDMSKCDVVYFDTIMKHIPQKLSEIDETFEPYLDRKLTELNPIEYAVIRLATYELLYCLEIPYRVVINEAISLAKEYGSEDGHKYVNGILNKVARKIRTAEEFTDRA
jgi:N utilization substance protein B